MTGVDTPELAPDLLLDKTRFLVGVVMLRNSGCDR
jgi:hypothetical protein